MQHPSQSLVRQRLATPQDIDFFLKQEAREDFRSLIFQNSREEHQRNLSDPNKQYLIFEAQLFEAQLNEAQLSEAQTSQPIGYAILLDVQSPHRSLNLARIVIAQPNQGYGKQALRLVVKQVFVMHQAHRLWLDVFEHNHRAQRVYQAIGFRPEGVLREAVKREERYDSLILMSMLEQEYRSRYDPGFAAGAGSGGRG